MGKRIVLFNDLPGYGKVALAAMVPLFSRMGHFPYQVPTAVVSNTLDFGKFRIQDMTDYMRDTIKVWMSWALIRTASVLDLYFRRSRWN